jgi:hypothetical protein
MEEPKQTKPSDIIKYYVDKDMRENTVDPRFYGYQPQIHSYIIAIIKYLDERAEKVNSEDKIMIDWEINKH